MSEGFDLSFDADDELLVSPEVMEWFSEMENLQAATHGRAVNRGMRFAIYTEPLFKTTNDADNRASVAATSTAELDLVGSASMATAKPSTRSPAD